MPLQATSGAASYEAFGGGVPFVPTYIEDVMSTFLYTGNGSTQTITNGIDLAGKGGMTWIKSRSAATDNFVFDTNRGALNEINTNNTQAQASLANSLTAFNSNGFSLGAAAGINVNAATYASWNFRKQAKFFTFGTYTGNGTAGRQIAHDLGSVPGVVIVKVVSGSSTQDWEVYHRSLGATQFIQLSKTDAATTSSSKWNNTEPTSTAFTVGSDAGVNANGWTYAYYVFAHNAGGFGLTGTDNVISCGSYTGNGSTTGPTVTLGYEPQWVLIKDASNASPDWWMFDNMRGVATGGVDMGLRPNTSGAEVTANDYLSFTATGFQPTNTTNTVNQSGDTYIYIAIRRGPMKVPTDGTKVLGLSARTGTGANATVTGSAGVTDLAIVKNRGSTPVWAWASRLTNTGYLSSDATTAETAAGTTILQANPWDVMDGVKVGTTSTITNATSNTFINYLFRRAPGFFDEVFYTGTGSSSTVAHNLAAVPELLIVKKRSAVNDWYVMGLFTPTTHGYGNLNLTDNWSLNQTYAAAGLLTGQPTSTGFTVSSSSGVLTASGATYVAYLFASAPGVSKVGTYTGNGVNAAGGGQTINCGFTAGARFVLIKRTNAPGDWYVFDSARGIVAAADPYLKLNTTAAEVTTIDVVDTASSGFIVNQEANTNLNVNAATYIFLAVS